MLLKLIHQAICRHHFVYIKDVWGFDGDILMHQYKCKKCGRKDYLYPEDDPDKDWNKGRGDGKLCNLLHQEPRGGN